MSWAVHDPEGWNQCCREAVTRHLEESFLLMFNTSIAEGYTMSDVVEWLQGEFPGAFEKVFEGLPPGYLDDATSDYFSNKASQLYEAGKR